MNPIRSIRIGGYKSIRERDDLPRTNPDVAIGGDGAGKSNFISAFHLLERLMASKP